jgi:dipeptidyl aminopeptidase/acylaminoacyl peptidase
VTVNDASPEVDRTTTLSPPRSSRQALFERYFAVRGYWGNLAFAPDGSQLAYITNTSGQLNIWRQSMLGGWPFQVTVHEEASARTVLWTPSGELLGMADSGGSEQYQIFGIPAQGGPVRPYTDRGDVQYRLGEHSLSPDGSLLAFSGNDRDPTEPDILVLDLASGEQRRLLEGGTYAPGYWSPDGRYLSVSDECSNINQRLLLLDVTTGEAREILPHTDDYMLLPGPWLPDGSGFYVITNRGREFNGVARYLLDAERAEWVLMPEWDVEQLALSRDGRRMIWSQNEHGYSRLYLRDEGLPPMQITGLPAGVIEAIALAPDGQSVALRLNAATAPADVYLLTLGPAGTPQSPQLRRLTHGMLGGLAPADLVEPELVRYATFDGREVPAWLYRPRGITAGERVPLALAIHGGPEAQERPTYQPFYQYLLASGIGVLAPNHRGSSGYGISYQKLVRRDFGGDDLKDLQASVEYARALPWVDPERLAIFGGSYGGFMTLSAITRLPEYWAAAVDFFGPSDLISAMRSVPPTWRKTLADWCGDPDDDAQMLREHSPSTYVEQMRAPLLVMQGANDPRVVRAESDQMVERLRGLGREVEYHVFEGEGHGFDKRANLLRAYQYAAAFFARHLLDRKDHEAAWLTAG